MGVTRILLLFTIAITMAMFVVWGKNETIQMGYQIAMLQKKHAELFEKKRKLNHYVNQLKSPEIIANKVHSLKLTLVPREYQPGILMAGQIKLKEQATGVTKATFYKNLYTQKESVLPVSFKDQ